MKSLRETLVASHIAAVAVAVLILFSFDRLVRAILEALPTAAYFVATAIAIRGMPYVSSRTGLLDQFGLAPVLYNLFSAVVSFGFAYLLSRYAYGVGPFTSLRKYRPLLAGRNHV
ncbi:MAG TPA: hypothetical protein VGR81_08320 [Candidatus Acidoferrales bacterium]|nr:hypothetical protein [Candidatus Acidoferrales bacterium]